MNGNQIRLFEQAGQQDRCIAEADKEFGMPSEQIPIQLPCHPQAAKTAADGHDGFDLFVPPQGMQMLCPPGIGIGQIAVAGLGWSLDLDREPLLLHHPDACLQPLHVAHRSGRAKQADGVAPF